MDCGFIDTIMDFFSNSWIFCFIYITYILGLVCILIMNEGHLMDDIKKHFLTWGTGVVMFYSIPFIFILIVKKGKFFIFF